MKYLFATDSVATVLPVAIDVPPQWCRSFNRAQDEVRENTIEQDRATLFQERNSKLTVLQNGDMIPCFMERFNPVEISRC